MRTRPAPHPWALEEPSTYKVHKGSVKSRLPLLVTWTWLWVGMGSIVICGLATAWGSVNSDIKLATAWPFVAGRVRSEAPSRNHQGECQFLDVWVPNLGVL
ncbi:unnamed protein product [Prunus armeniaca]